MAPVSPDPLSDQRYVSVIVRFALGGNPFRLRGELVDTEDNVTSRFVGWSGLTRALRTWLDSQRKSGTFKPSKN